MKNISAIVTILLLASFVSAADIVIKEGFDQGETLIAKTSGSFFSSVSKDNVVFYKGHVKTSVVHDVEKINDDYYIYGQLIDKSPGNYSIVIENARYFNGSKVETKDIEKNFTITEDKADFSIDKGAITTNQSFSITVKNLKDSAVTISIGEKESSQSGSDSGGGGGFFDTLFGNSQSADSGSEVSSLTLKAGESRKIDFAIGANEPLFHYVTFSSEKTYYEVPVYVFSATSQDKSGNLRFEPAFIEVQMATSSESRAVFYIVNTEDEDAENIYIVVSEEIQPYVLLSTEYADSISGNFNKKIEMDIASDFAEKSVKGNIAVIFGQDEKQIILPVTLDFIKDYVSSDSSSVSGTTSKTCAELEGKICSSGQECTGDLEYAMDGVCCLAQCKSIEKSSTGKVIGWVMIISLIVFVIWFYLKRYRKVESVSDLRRVLGR